MAVLGALTGVLIMWMLVTLLEEKPPENPPACSSRSMSMFKCQKWSCPKHGVGRRP